MIQDTYTICNNLAYILIDSGASHSLVSHAFAKKLNVLPKNLDSVLFVSTPKHGTLLGKVIYEACIIEIADRELSINLIEIDRKF